MYNTIRIRLIFNFFRICRVDDEFYDDDLYYFFVEYNTNYFSLLLIMDVITNNDYVHHTTDHFRLYTQCHITYRIYCVS